MKVFFVGSNLNGCYNVRCLFPLQANGWDGDRTSFGLERMTPENKAKAMADADIVVFHRPERKERLEAARLLKKEGKKIVFDNDDTYKDYGGFKFNEYMDKQMLDKGLSRINENIDTFIKEADLVTCSTEFLKEEYKKINPNVIVLPNCVDPFYFDEPLRNESDIIRIGITGSVGVTSDIEPLKPIIEHYQNDPRVRIVLLSMPPQTENEIYKELYKEEYNFWSKVNMEWHTYVPADEYYDYLNNLKLDMVIIPRYDSLFNRCKSNLKFLENSALQIPSICQAFSTGDSPYQQNKSDEPYLLLANTFEEWIEKIELLINDKKLRRELGEKAQKYVFDNYSIEKNAWKWKEAYETLLKQ
jgi:glycosyltransferase involved in cell wall biosynthesis